MKKLHFRYAAAKNFLCFGPEGVEFFFKDYGPVVVIKGINRDNLPPDADDYTAALHSNATGKSSVQDILAYALYGKPVKEPTKSKGGKVINKLVEGGLVAEVQFDEYRVVRELEPNKLRMWESKDHIWDSQSEIRQDKSEIQKKIDRLIGLSHAAFCNVVVFTDENRNAFLELGAPGKREVIENLLGLDRYKDYFETAKKKLRDQKESIKDLTKDYETFQNEIDACESRLTKVREQEHSWRSQQHKEIHDVGTAILKKQAELDSTTNGTLLAIYEEAQTKSQTLQSSIAELTIKKKKMVELIETAHQQLEKGQLGRDAIWKSVQEREVAVQIVQGEMTAANNSARALEALEEGQRCGVCRGIVSRENYHGVLTHEQNKIASCQERLTKQQESLASERRKLEDHSTALKKLKTHIKQAESQLGLLDKRIDGERNQSIILRGVQKPDSNAQTRVVEAQIVELKKQRREKETEVNGSSPYKEILEETEKEKKDKVIACEQSTSKLRDAEKHIPYLEAGVEAFGDKGIRKNVVDGIIPALNARICYWLQYLIDGRLELNFDNELTETITRNGTPADYHLTSNGEKRASISPYLRRLRML